MAYTAGDLAHLYRRPHTAGIHTGAIGASSNQDQSPQLLAPPGAGSGSNGATTAAEIVSAILPGERDHGGTSAGTSPTSGGAEGTKW